MGIVAFFQGVQAFFREVIVFFLELGEFFGEASFLVFVLFLEAFLFLVVVLEALASLVRRLFFQRETIPPFPLF